MARFKILFVSANAIPGAALRVDDEYKEVKRQLHRSKNFETPRYNPSSTWEEVIDEIKGYKPDIVHFSAHGSPSEQIVLNNEHGKPAAISTKALALLFRVMKGNVRVVVMNSCFSARQARAIARFVGCVVGVKLRLADDTAIKFSPRFYEALAEGVSVAAAYDAAMISVYGGHPGNDQVPKLLKGAVPPDEIVFVKSRRKQAQPSPQLSEDKKIELSASAEDTAVTPSPPKAADRICQSLHWDVRIDEEGDAYNEMAYGGIVLPARRPYVFELLPAEVQSGHTTEFTLMWDGRTIEGTSLKVGSISSTKVQMNVHFTNRPTPPNPARFAISGWDWNVFSMNLEEFRQKPHFSETDNGVDYAQKLVSETWRTFTLLIQFPLQMVFALPPYFEIYYPPEASETGRNDDLTDRYRCCFHYSRALNLATLSVEQPPAPFCYRISWQLGQSRAAVASPLTPQQRAKQQTFASRLLRMRRTLETNGVEKADAAKLKESVDAVLASVAEHVYKTLGGAELDPQTLEISLMVLDEEHKEKAPPNDSEYPVLRIVAGTLLEEPAYRKLFFFVGDGNAGRAWKHRMARVYDLNETDPKRHIYVPIPGAFRHCFLVSVPLIDPSSNALIYGILNLGTSSKEQAELLRQFGTAPGIEDLTSHAQSYVLHRLKELIRLS